MLYVNCSLAGAGRGEEKKSRKGKRNNRNPDRMRSASGQESHLYVEFRKTAAKAEK
jgi:hypothetical protein